MVKQIVLINLMNLRTSVHLYIVHNLTLDVRMVHVSTVMQNAMENWIALMVQMNCQLYVIQLQRLHLQL